MIASLRGSLLAKSEEFILVDVGGVGYRVFIPHTVMVRLPKLNSPIFIFTYYHHREDQVHLYGFLDWHDLEFFKLLLEVSGIGPKAGMAMLSLFSANEVEQAILGEDINALVKIPGIGRKIAQRLVIELKDKLLKRGKAGILLAGSNSINLGVPPLIDDASDATKQAVPGSDSHDTATGEVIEEKVFSLENDSSINRYEDALGALFSLGYNQAEARAAIGQARLELGVEASVENLIKKALKKLVR